MRIGIDISQLAYEGTGVAEYLSQLVKHLVAVDSKNEYVLFFSSFRKEVPVSISQLAQHNTQVKLSLIKLPLRFLTFLWNKLHIAPIEWFIGDVDIFITSDWIEPPVRRAKKATILYDLIVYKYPEETAQSIVNTQRMKLKWIKKESDMIFCISESTKKDAMDVLGIEERRLRVIYPGIQV